MRLVEDSLACYDSGRSLNCERYHINFIVEITDVLLSPNKGFGIIRLDMAASNKIERDTI
jgi:hypothetical protein